MSVPASGRPGAVEINAASNAFARAVSAEATSGRLRQAQIAAVFGNVLIGVCGAAAAAVALAVSLVRLKGTSFIVGTAWAGSIVLCAALHIGLWVLYRRPPAHRARSAFWGIWFTAITFAEGIGWGWGSIGLVTGDRLDLHLVAFVVCFGVAAGAVPAFGPFVPAFAVMFLSATTPVLVKSMLSLGHSPQDAFFLMLSAVFIMALGGLGLRFNANFRDIVLLRIRGDDLAAELRRQKEVAEQASLAKSTFLAAASHDLRQPVHALSLFVGALRNVAIPPTGSGCSTRSKPRRSPSTGCSGPSSTSRGSMPASSIARPVPSRSTICSGACAPTMRPRRRPRRSRS